MVIGLICVSASEETGYEFNCCDDADCRQFRLIINPEFTKYRTIGGKIEEMTPELLHMVMDELRLYMLDHAQ